MEQFVFYSLASIVVISALAVVLLRNTLHCALFLGLALAGVAGIYGSLGADFLFAAQIMVYVSGVAVLVMFVVMLAGRASELGMRQINQQWLGASVIAAITFFGFMRFIGVFRDTLVRSAPEPTSHDLGRVLLGPYAVPFELVSIILIVALVGAVLYGRPESPQEDAQ
jgi:NADH:ubiquinone oxidoreductase subunit 6 (subunit J)